MGPLSVGELDLVLAGRLGLRWPRPKLLDLHRVSAGNVFFAMTIARAAGEGEVVVPEDLQDLVRAQVEGLPEEGREASLLVAAASRPTAALVQRAAGGDRGLRQATDAGVLVVDGERIRFSHPLLASAIYGTEPPWERRRIHRVLAAVAEGEERARQPALGTDEPDEQVAEEIERAAAAASGRGAPESAADLGEHAIRLTPRENPGAALRRRSMAAEYHIAAGDPMRGRTMLEDAVNEAERGPLRLELLYRLADAVGDDLSESMRPCEQALDETQDDAGRLGPIQSALTTFTWLAGDHQRALDHTRKAAESAERSGDLPLLAYSHVVGRQGASMSCAVPTR